MLKTHITQTSLDAYDDLKQHHVLGALQSRVIKAMHPKIFYTRKQLAMKLDMETSTLSGRVNELISYGYIEVVSQIKCPISNRMVEAIKLTEKGAHYEQ
jgi:DNA-binding MarR family transcriptional regulator